MYAERTSAGEAILPDPTLESNAPHDSWHQTVLLSKLEERLNGNHDSLIYCPFIVIVYKYRLDALVHLLGNRLQTSLPTYMSLFPQCCKMICWRKKKQQ